MRAREMSVHDPVGDFVSANPWTTVAVGAGVAIAAGVTAWLFARSSTPAATTTTTTTTSTSDGSTRDGSTSKPTTTTTSTPTSTTSSTSSSSSSTPTTSTSSSSSSAPTYNASKAVRIHIQSADTAVSKLPVGTSFIIADASTDQVLTTAQVSGQAGVLAAGPTPGTFVAIAPGQVKVYNPATSVGVVLNVVAATGTAGVPKVAALLLPQSLRAA